MWPRQRTTGHGARPALWLAVGAGSPVPPAPGPRSPPRARARDARLHRSPPAPLRRARCPVYRHPASGVSAWMRGSRRYAGFCAARCARPARRRAPGSSTSAIGRCCSTRARMRRSLASNSKPFTAVGALRRLGPGARLATVVLGVGELRPDRTFRGDLYLKGSGDPSLSRAGLRVLAHPARRPARDPTRDRPDRR